MTPSEEKESFDLAQDHLILNEVRVAAREYLDDILEYERSRLRRPSDEVEYISPAKLESVSFQRLTVAIKLVHPRFSVPAGNADYDSANLYARRLFDTYRLRLRGLMPFDRNVSDERSDLIDELLHTVRCQSRPVAQCCLVEQLTTSSGERMEIEGVEIIPSNPTSIPRRESWIDQIEAIIPAATGSIPPDFDVLTDEPLSVLVARDTRENFHYNFDTLPRALNRLLLILKLTYGGTHRPLMSMWGECSKVGALAPAFSYFRGDFGIAPQTRAVYRVTEVRAADSNFLRELGTLIDKSLERVVGLVINPFAVAFSRLAIIAHETNWFDQLLDLSIAIEAMLGGDGVQDVGLRIRSRAAILLCTEDDEPQQIFKDVRILYDIRSRIAHGDMMTESWLMARLNQISTVPAGTDLVVAYGIAIDRMADLVRRSIVCRLVLSHGIDPIWAPHSDRGIDEKLSSTSIQVEWRSKWMDWCNVSGCPPVVNNLGAPNDSLTRRPLTR